MNTDRKVIDVHSHMILPEYLEAMEAEGIDPLKEDGFPTPEWSVEQHLEFMEKAGLEHCILSLSTPHIHHGDGAAAIRAAKSINDATAEICRAHPDRFHFAACLPMPEKEASVEEAVRSFDELGAAAVKVASNSNGVYLGDALFDPLFAELDRRGAVMIIHPSRPLQVPDRVFTHGPAPLFEYLADTTRAVINMITSGTIKKYPNIKIVVPHSGSFLPLVIHRLTGISEVLIPKGLMSKVDVEEDFSKLYFDIAGDALPLALDTLLKIADPKHIMYGADFPHTPQEVIIRKKKAIEEHLEKLHLAEDIMYNNAKALFQL